MKSRIFIPVILLILFGGITAALPQSNEANDYLYAQRLLNDNMHELAAKQFREFMETYPTSPKAPEALFMAGEAWFQGENFNEARRAFLEVSGRYPQAPKNDEAHMRVGDCHRELQEYEEAAKAY